MQLVDAAQPARDLVAVHAGQADVEQDHVGANSARRRAAPAGPSWPRLDLVPGEPQQQGQACAASRLSSTTRTRARRVVELGSALGAGAGRSADRSAEAGSARGTRCRGRPRRSSPRPRPPCISTRRRTSVRPMPEAALAAVERAVDLGEQVEDVAAASPPRCRCRCRARATTTSPPSRVAASETRSRRLRSVYLAALLSRLASTCASRVGVAAQPAPARSGSATWRAGAGAAR